MAIGKRRQQEEERMIARKRRAVLELYKDRLAVLRRGMEQSKEEKFKEAIESYQNYLNILAEFHQVEERRLSPALFDKEKMTSELLLISQVYWDMAKIYDRNPRLFNESERCLNQFVKFSAGFKYQFVNAEMLRKFIKQKKAHNIHSFKKAYENLRATSGACFIATYCFGNDHQVLIPLRQFKLVLLRSLIGKIFVEYYYRLSPPLVSALEKFPYKLQFLLKFLIKPFLSTLSLILKKALK